MKKISPIIRQSDVCNIPCFDRAKVAAIKARLTQDNAALPQLAEYYKLLGNTTRLKILLALADGELCVCDIAHVLSLSVAATSHQLKLLHSQGWLRKRDDGKMVYYHLKQKMLLRALRDDRLMLTKRLG